MLYLAYTACLISPEYEHDSQRWNGSASVDGHSGHAEDKRMNQGVAARLQVVRDGRVLSAASLMYRIDANLTANPAQLMQPNGVVMGFDMIDLHICRLHR